METIKEIVREMRKRCKDKGHSPELWDYLDRIEAAHNREVDDALDTGAFVAEAQKQTVTDCNCLNGAKCREALMFLLENADFLLGVELPHWHERVIRKAVERAKEALSAPARNCDVGTAKEQSKRHRKWCFEFRECPAEWKSSCQHPRGVCKCSYCFACWSQMPYDEGGAK